MAFPHQLQTKEIRNGFPSLLDSMQIVGYSLSRREVLWPM
jgi:hypothetical protein